MGSPCSIPQRHQTLPPEAGEAIGGTSDQQPSGPRSGPDGPEAKPPLALALLHARRLPGRLTTEQTATVLGFQPHDIAVLCNAKLLAPLGQPAQSAPKYFAAVTIAKLAADPAWLEEATIATTENWKRKNRAHQSKNGAHHPRQRRSRYAS